MPTNAYNEEGKSYIEAFKEWLESNNHTSILEVINWEDERNKVKVDYLEDEDGRYFLSINKWRIVWNKEIIEKEDKKERFLQIKILLYQWFKREVEGIKVTSHDTIGNPPSYVEKLEKQLANYRYWKKLKQQVPYFGIILVITGIALYLAWPNSKLEYEDLKEEFRVQTK